MGRAQHNVLKNGTKRTHDTGLLLDGSTVYAIR